MFLLNFSINKRRLKNSLSYFWNIIIYPYISQHDLNQIHGPSFSLLILQSCQLVLSSFKFSIYWYSLRISFVLKSRNTHDLVIVKLEISMRLEIKVSAIIFSQFQLASFDFKRLIYSVRQNWLLHQRSLPDNLSLILEQRRDSCWYQILTFFLSMALTYLSMFVGHLKLSLMLLLTPNPQLHLVNLF